MKMRYILVLDQSTSGSKAMLINEMGRIICKKSIEHKQYYPKPGWVEHDPLEIYENCMKLLVNITKETGLQEDIDVLAVTNQRETVLIWDKETGQPIYNAIVWQCRRTADICDKLKAEGLEASIQEKTGLQLDPYFSATKIKWILENVDGAKQKAKEGKLCIGTMDSWIIWKLTGGKVHATDYTNASRTLLFNIHTLKWDEELLKIFGVTNEMLPEVKSSNEIFGYTSKEELFERSIPISGVIGDSQGALFGQQCTRPGMAKATYGTGSSVMMHVGPKLISSQKGLVSAIAWGIDNKVEYALEGIVHCSGDALKWVKDNLELFNTFDEAEKMIAELKDNEGVYMVPAFVGLGVPYWNPYARAAVVGMSRGTSKAHFVRAAMEAIAYQINDAISVMVEESGIALKELKADGGPTRNEFLMQFQASLLQTPVNVSKVAELSAMGAVYLAGLGVGIWKSIDEIQKVIETGKVYKPCMSQELRKKYLSGWKKAVNQVLSNCNNQTHFTL